MATISIFVTFFSVLGLSTGEYCHQKMYCIPEKQSDINLVPVIGATFYLYTPEKIETPSDIVNAHSDSNWTAASDLPQGFKENGYTVFIIHGFTGGVEDGQAEWVQPMKDALLQNGKAENVFLVDWAKGANFNLEIKKNVFSLGGYKKAAMSTEVIGSLVAKYMAFLVDSGKLKYSDLHCVGFSLGGQVCGYVGYYIRENTKSKIYRISGLDPAGPYFKKRPDERKRLDKSDAEFVDVIHTNAGTFGIDRNVGHVDFYAGKTNKFVGLLKINYAGKLQPGCSIIGYCLPKIAVQITDSSEPTFKSGKKPNLGDRFVNWAGCSHNRATEYFILSIKGECNYETEEGNQMGWNADPNGKLGRIDVAIPNVKPYCSDLKY